MRKLLLITLLIGLSVMCSGQDLYYKTPKEVQKVEHELSLQKVKYKKASKKPDSLSSIVSKWCISEKDVSDHLAIKPIENNAKATISQFGFIIYLDQFKVTDTIFIQAGKRKIGIPAYKFLEYFNEPTPNYIDGARNLHLFDHLKFDGLIPL